MWYNSASVQVLAVHTLDPLVSLRRYVTVQLLVLQNVCITFSIVESLYLYMYFTEAFYKSKFSTKGWEGGLGLGCIYGGNW